MDKRQRVFNKFNGRCAYCGCELDEMTFHIDHINPKSKTKPGTNDIDNYNPACQDCNLCKGNLTLEEFRDKVYGSLLQTFQGRMICKYYDVSTEDHLFYFEKIKAH